MRARIRLSRLASLAAVLAATLFLSGCEYFSSPQNTFAPAGEPAQQQKDDFLLVMWPALVVGLIVMFALVIIALKFRRKPGDPGLPKQVHGNTALELTWTVIPIILLAVIAVPTVDGIRDLAREPDAETRLDVKVTGQRFDWLFEYPTIDVAGSPLSTEPGVLRIPVDRDIYFEITSIDVNHSFWVPKLAGKTDAINNHTNYMWLRATKPGEYQGQCAEFCGLNHYDMRLVVIAMPQDEFDAWVEEQRSQAEARSRTTSDDLQFATNGE